MEKWQFLNQPQDAHIYIHSTHVYLADTIRDQMQCILVYSTRAVFEDE